MTGDRQAGAVGAVALVGFMASGKSAVGRLAAGVLAVPFVDVDALLERAHGPIAEQFAVHGEHAFRRRERDVAVAALGQALTAPCVLALGGGAVLSGDVREALARLPHVAWLTAPVEVLWGRVCAEASGLRPLARDEASFRRLYAERAALYAQVATATVVNDGGRPLVEVAAEVAAVAAGTRAAAAAQGGSASSS
ncbi:MAG: shikimate kinase [Thermoleophilia bacterium]